MEKPAPADHPIHDIIRNRWSPRAFGDRSIPSSELAAIFEAARWAPSAFNDQPWYFLVAARDEPQEFERMLECLVEGNRIWAKGAAALAISVARTTYAHNGSTYRHAYYDTAQAVAALTFQATALGMRVHQMAGFDVEETKIKYGLPEGHDPVTAIALGYPGDAGTLPEKLRRAELAERTRRPLRETVFFGHWGVPRTDI
jgi:nitroreductase